MGKFKIGDKVESDLFGDIHYAIIIKDLSPQGGEWIGWYDTRTVGFDGCEGLSCFHEDTIQPYGTEEAEMMRRLNKT